MADYKQLFFDLKWAAILTVVGILGSIYAGYEYIFTNTISFIFIIPLFVLATLIAIVGIVWGIITLISGLLSMGKRKTKESL